MRCGVRDVRCVGISSIGSISIRGGGIFFLIVGIMHYQALFRPTPRRAAVRVVRGHGQHAAQTLRRRHAGSPRPTAEHDDEQRTSMHMAAARRGNAINRNRAQGGRGREGEQQKNLGHYITTRPSHVSSKPAKTAAIDMERGTKNTYLYNYIML